MLCSRDSTALWYTKHDRNKSDTFLRTFGHSVTWDTFFHMAITTLLTFFINICHNSVTTKVHDTEILPQATQRTTFSSRLLCYVKLWQVLSLTSSRAISIVNIFLKYKWTKSFIIKTVIIPRPLVDWHRHQTHYISNLWIKLWYILASVSLKWQPASLIFSPNPRPRNCKRISVFMLWTSTIVMKTTR